MLTIIPKFINQIWNRWLSAGYNKINNKKLYIPIIKELVSDDNENCLQKKKPDE